MISVKSILNPIIVISVLLITGCSTADMAKNNESNEPMTLRQHLERISGITLRGTRENTKVQVRGTSSLTQTGYTQPLFVVDGNKIGRDFYFVASNLQPESILSVRYLRGAGANMYGSEGSQGVFVIKTTQND